MSKEFNHIDDLFQAAFADESAEVPAFVKTNIDKKLGFHSRRKAWFWFGAIMALMLISVSSVALIHYQENTFSDVSPRSENKNPIPTKSFVKTNSSSTLETEESEKITTLEQTESVFTMPHTSATKRDYTTSEFHQYTKEFKEKHQPASGNATNDPKNNQITGPWTPDTVIPKSTETNYRQSLTSKLFERQENLNLNALTNPGFKLLAPATSLTTPQTILEAETIEPRESYDPWMISGTAGVQFSNSRYTTQSQADTELYKNAHNDKPGFEGNLDIRYSLKNSLTFGSGLAISQLAENYSYFKEQYSYDSTMIWTYTYVYDSIDTSLIIDVDSSYVVEYDSVQTTPLNYYGTTQATYLQLPFSIGTHIVREKFCFDFFAMGRFNYLLKGSGGYMQNDLFTNFDGSSQIFKTWYVDLILGASVHYQLLDKLYLSGTFRYRPRIGNLYEGLSFNRAIQSYHLGIGLSWKF